MVTIDLRTLVFSFVITNIIVTLIIVMLWYQNRRRFSGTFLWVIDFFFQTTALILISLRGAIPDWISMVVSNALVIAGTILGLIALERFAGVKRNNYHNYILLLIFVVLSIWFSQVKPDLAVRNLNLAVTMLIITLQCSWLIFFKVKSEMRKIATGVGVVFLAYSLVNVLRIGDFFITDHSATDYFDSGVLEMFVIVSYQMLFILLTYNLALMFNKRLLKDVKVQEEKFSKAFHSSPYAIILTRLTDGKIFEVNKGFEDISGFQPTEVLGVNTNDLNIWYKEEERTKYVEELSRSGRVTEKDLQFRKKSGEPLRCLMSSEIILINGEECVLSSINDITERKKVEAEVKLNEARLESLLRISLSESKSLQSFLDNALSEAILLTQSKIGYIYFYSEEKKEFTLNTWSEKVMDSCKVLEKQTIYQLEKTGIWGEAVRQRKAIVINDFHAVNPLKKGYPEGHVTLDKFMTIPVFSDNRIVAVVAVANKEIDYNDADVRQLTLMMQSVWNFTEKMRMETSLKETEAVLMAAMDCSPSGIAIADAPDGKLRYVNKAGLMIPGKTEEEIVDNIDISNYVSSWHIKHHDGTPYKPDEVPLARAVLYGETNSREFIISRDDNDDRVVLANAAPILDDGGKVKAGIVVFHDITDYKKGENQLSEKIQELEKFNKIMVGRELKMVELKQEINELCGKLKLPKRYKAQEEGIM